MKRNKESTTLTELSTSAFGKCISTSLFLRSLFFIRVLAFLGAVGGSLCPAGRLSLGTKQADKKMETTRHDWE